MARYILIDSNYLIVNVIEWDGQAEWTPPTGQTAIAFEGISSSGWTWDGTQAVDPNAASELIGGAPNVIA